MQIVGDIDPLRRAVQDLRRDGAVALVPTMGALHEGHLTLMQEARRRAAHVVASIFVNPRQFGANEDLDAYPRPFERDCARLEEAGVSLVWAPSVDAMYPHGYATNISVSGISDGLCGAARPGHFDGVATVVCKLFNQVCPDLAFFGEKDWQQLAVIRRMARDLDLSQPAFGDIIGVSTVREADGLAMSSRNAYLTPDERIRAAALPRAMRTAIEALERAEDARPVLSALIDELLKAGFNAVDYAELRDAETLVPLDRNGAAPTRLLVAARIGRTRLIDNMPIAPSFRD